jgi:hypothetical protein
MGNFHSAHIDCVIDKQSGLKPGENLTGSVLLTIHNEHDVEKNFEGITLVVAGVEYALIKAREEDDKDVVMPTSKVVKVKSVIPLKADSFTNGEHEYPFEVPLPTQEHHAEHYRKSLSSGDSVWTSADGTASSDNTAATPTPAAPARHVFREDSVDMSETSDLSVSPFVTMTKRFEAPESDGVEKTIVYHVRASLKRKKGVPLIVDTDIKCRARCVATEAAA